MHQGVIGNVAQTKSEAAQARIALVLVLAFALARIVFACTMGFGPDEAFSITVARQLDLSYFDHPPLHQWITHVATFIFGETLLLRLPFIALFAGTSWLMFRLTRRLFGASAGVWAVFALNASVFFFVSPGSGIYPDGPLFFALAAAALAFAALFFDNPPPDAAWRLWLAGGFWLGVAALSKYSAVFFAVGLVIFLLVTPRQRRWFVHPAPYTAALVCLAVLLPVFIWNARNHWVSFTFQGSRLATDSASQPMRLALRLIVGELAMLTPWIAVPLVIALFQAARQSPTDTARRYLLCLALPPILLFNVAPLVGSKVVQMHWPMPGWFFAYPLLGAWVVEASARGFRARRWAVSAAVLLATMATLVVSQIRTGWIERLGLLPRARDPTSDVLSWAGLNSSPLLGAESNTAFVVASSWSEAGRIGLGLGPRLPVTVFSNDPRGIAFLTDLATFVGKDAVIVVQRGRETPYLDQYRPYFERLDAPQTFAIGRGGMHEIDFLLVPAHRLIRPFPLPYSR